MFQEIDHRNPIATLEVGFANLFEIRQRSLRFDRLIHHVEAQLPEWGGPARDSGRAAFDWFCVFQLLVSTLDLVRVATGALASAWRRMPEAVRSVVSMSVLVPTCSSMRRNSIVSLS